MAIGHRRSFKISVQAKICNLYIKLKATLKLPSGKFQRLLKLDKLLIEVDSKSVSRILLQRRRTLKSRMLSFVKKHLGHRRSKFPHAESRYRSWHVGLLERRCVAAFGVGLGYVVVALKTQIELANAIGPSFSSIIWVYLCNSWIEGNPMSTNSSCFKTILLHRRLQHKNHPLVNAIILLPRDIYPNQY
uniref:50S ribosomal protein L35 n=1 Tax=Cucumis sativus TaxID=3659 RepID=A0A0A0LCL9_CUCSA